MANTNPLASSADMKTMIAVLKDISNKLNDTPMASGTSKTATATKRFDPTKEMREYLKDMKKTDFIKHPFVQRMLKTELGKSFLKVGYYMKEQTQKLFYTLKSSMGKLFGEIFGDLYNQLSPFIDVIKALGNYIYSMVLKPIGKAAKWGVGKLFGGNVGKDKTEIIATESVRQTSLLKRIYGVLRSGPPRTVGVTAGIGVAGGLGDIVSSIVPDSYMTAIKLAFGVVAVGGIGYMAWNSLDEETKTSIKNGFKEALILMLQYSAGAIWDVVKWASKEGGNWLLKEVGNSLTFSNQSTYNSLFKNGGDPMNRQLKGMGDVPDDQWGAMQKSYGSDLQVIRGDTAPWLQNILNWFKPDQFATPDKSAHTRPGMAKDVPKDIADKLESGGFLKRFGFYRPDATGDPGHIEYGGGSGGIDDIIRRASIKWGVPEDLIRGVISAESNFGVNRTSPKGAMGLMQLMPGTARDLGVTNAFDPEQNIMGGTEYLKKQLDKYHDVELALAAYNAGSGNVDKYGGIPPFAETQQYIARVKSMMGAKGSLSFAGTGGTGGATSSFMNSMMTNLSSPEGAFGSLLSQGLMNTPLSSLEASKGDPLAGMGDAVSAIRGAESGLSMISQMGDPGTTGSGSTSISSNNNIANSTSGGESTPSNPVPEPSKNILGNTPMMWLVYNNSI